MKSASTLKPVKIFLSYSWSSPAHEKWVVDLATRLRSDGIDVVLDKWDLKPGHDAYKFMEQMVTDEFVSKVVMICDRAYQSKANKRQGGVGAESQIISPELYSKSTQDKFAAIVTELDDSAQPCAPAFYKGRIHFDFMRDENFEKEYDALLRWIVGKPIYVKPEIGTVPRHLTDDNFVILATESSFRRAVEAVRSGQARANGFVREFSTIFVHEFEKLRIHKQGEGEFDDRVIELIKNGRAYLEQLFQLTITICRFSEDGAEYEQLGRLMEGLAPYMYRPENVSTWSSWDFDNFKSLCHLAFLGCLAITLKEECFAFAQVLLSRRYLIEHSDSEARGSNSFEVFHQIPEVFEHRNRRLNLKRFSFYADFIKEMFSHGEPTFEDVMQADFVAYLRHMLHRTKDRYTWWYPITLVHATSRYRPFEIFRRAESASYFAQLKSLLGISDSEVFKAQLLNNFGSEQSLQFGWGLVSASTLANCEKLATFV